MKKLLLSLILLLACQISFGKSLNDITDQYKTVENAQFMMVPQSMVKMLVGQMLNQKEIADKVKNNNASAEDINKVVEKIDSVLYLSLDNCTGSVKSSFNEKVKDLSVYGYKKMEEKPGLGAVYCKEQNGIAKEVVVLITKGGDCDFVQFYGKLKPQEITEIISRISNLKI